MLLATVIWHLMIKVSDHHPYISDDNQIISWSLYDDLVFIVSDDYLIISWSWYLVFKVSELKKQNRSLERGSKPGSSSSVAGRGYSHKKLYWPLIVAIVAIVAIIVATISIFVFHHWHCLYLWSDCARVEASQDLLRMVGNRLVIMITTWMIITLKIISFTMSPFKSFQNIFECRSKVNHIVDPYLHRLPCLR